MTAAGIVLAGGAARRFGHDKLAVEIDGRTLLERAVEAVAAVADTVVVALASDAPEPDIRVPRDVRLELVRDASAGGGPLVGLAAGLEAASRVGAERAIVVGGDMPWLRPSVLEALLGVLDDAALDACAPTVDGARRPLPAALRVGPALDATSARLGSAAGARSLLAFLEDLRTTGLDEVTWRALDPDGSSFRDVDRPSDLGRPDGTAG